MLLKRLARSQTEVSNTRLRPPVSLRCCVTLSILRVGLPMWVWSHLGTLVSFDMRDLLINGKSIRGICYGDSVPQKFIPNLVRLLMQGRFPFDRMVEFYPFDKINEAAADSEKGITLKPILIIDQTFPMSH